MRSRLLSLYVASVVLAGGVAVLALPAWHGQADLLTTVLLVALAGVAGARPVRIAALRTELVATQPFVLCALAAVGPYAATLVAVSGVVGAALARGRLRLSQRLVFNLGALSLTCSAAWLVFRALGGRPGMNLLAAFPALAAATTAYFLVNTGLVTTAISLEKQRPFLRVWRESYLWTAVSYACGLTLAAGLLLVLERLGLWALALGIPPALLLASFYRTHKEGLEEKLRRIRDVEALNAELERTVHDLRAALDDVRRGREDLRVEIQERRQTEEALRHSEEQLRQAQKMEAIGRLAGGIAHDFNNLLTAIGGYTDLILTQLHRDDPLRTNAEEVRKASDRAAALTRQLLAFSRRQVLEPKTLDVNAIVENMDKMLRRLIGEDVELVLSLGADMGKVRADPGQLEQVILNLAVNARDAMPHGGKLTLETANAASDFNPADPDLTAESYVRLTLRDTGCGIDKATQSRMFEPFFTTKEEGKGTGLGLSTVYGIVKQSQGTITVDSAPGRGAAFHVYLPRVDELPEQADKTVEPRRGAVRGTETVLLVEDEDQVRDLAGEVLRMNGYCVMEAASGTEALRVSAEHGGPIHLMLTDLIMPQMNGRELYERLNVQRPGTRVLFMSGYTDQAVLHEGLLQAGAVYLQKPFSLESLARKVRDVLDAEPVAVRPSPAERAAPLSTG